MPTREPLPPAVPRARTAVLDERGLTATHMLGVVVALGVAIVAMFLAIKPDASHHATTKPTAPPAVEPVLGPLQHDVTHTVHALLLDHDGCAHAPRQRAVVSFLADGSAPERASWYVEQHEGEWQLVRRDCRNGTLVGSGVIAPVVGHPIVACTPSCGHFETVRFSYDGAHGLTTVVAYRGGRAP